MFCIKCRAKLKAGDKFCKKCGQAVGEAEEPNQALESKPAVAPIAVPAPQPNDDGPMAQKQKTAKACGSCFGLLVILVVGVICYSGFSNYFKNLSSSSSSSSGSNKSTGSSSSSTKSNSSSGQTTTPSTQTTKQLYYSVGCSNCQSFVCQRGYSYAGWDAGIWQYYKDACNSCSCTDVKSQSVWR
ncbi:MAG: hypothetical protein NTW79_01435 [Candidatus Berkelbacteria bacterium]|nr:hypothetical protein [Candidatus Berkelbacteria bacterium]